MKTLEQRAENLLGWNEAIQQLVVNPVDLAEPYWQNREPSFERTFYATLAFGNFVMKASKLIVILPIVYYRENGFVKAAEAQGYKLNVIGPLQLAESIIGNSGS